MCFDFSQEQRRWMCKWPFRQMDKFGWSFWISPGNSWNPWPSGGLGLGALVEDLWATANPRKVKALSCGFWFSYRWRNFIYKEKETKCRRPFFLGPMVYLELWLEAFSSFSSTFMVVRLHCGTHRGKWEGRVNGKEDFTVRAKTLQAERLGTRPKLSVSQLCDFGSVT